MSKNIVICCDGTGNSSSDQEEGKSCTSNVWKFYDALITAPNCSWSQTGFYDSGVGTGTSSESKVLKFVGRMLALTGKTGDLIGKFAGILRRLVEAGTGAGISENILDGYSAIVREYQPGDRIYLIGFSRGAYTARCIAGVIRRAGLLKAEYARFAPDLIKMYVNRRPDAEVKLRPEVCHDSQGVDIEFIGVWDTVASLGLPLWGWWFRPLGFGSNAAFDRDSRPVDCKLACQALSMDEKRSQFFVTPFDERPAIPPQIVAKKIEQRWFRGTHAGVGGGYADTNLSDVSLLWMIERAKHMGLKFEPTKLAAIRANHLGIVHDELVRRPFWKVFGSWPRWFPCDRPTKADGLPGHPGFGSIDQSVMLRANVARGQRPHPTAVQPDELCWLDIGEKVEIKVRADCTWNRSGLILEPGGIYQFDYIRGTGGVWRDKEEGECGPEGQSAAGLVRGALQYAKRDSVARWFELMAYVAVPQRWPLKEKSMGQLLKLLMVSDPKELTDQHLRLGDAMKHDVRGLGNNLSACILMDRSMPAGMLYTFANDHWLFYRNNSGALVLTVTRLEERLENIPFFSLRLDHNKCVWFFSGKSGPGRNNGIRPKS